MAEILERDARAADMGWIAALPSLDDVQAGSLRRMFDLSAQLPDDWSGMMGRTTLQEDFGALRFQLAYMSYALALTHVHRLPAARALFQEPFDRLIQKILSPDVWTYWHFVSTGNGPYNSGLGELPAEWDPVIRDNIMYSAYVQSMALLYHYLFRDEKYAAPGALTFSVNPLFWGLGGKHFAYDERSLNEHIYWSMVERGYLGVACEPNCVFQICNQVPMIGFRFHDLVYGGNTARLATDGYVAAWQQFGIVNADGHYNMMVQERERKVVTPPARPWVDFWVAALMNAWNPDFVKLHYPEQMRRWARDASGGTAWIPPAPPNPNGPPLTSARDFGWGAVCASEVGDSETLARLLDYADTYLRPIRKDGAYYYPRHDEAFDADGKLSAMDPLTGNVLLGYARLNVPDGLRTLYEGPWNDAHFEEPSLAAMSATFDVRRASFDTERNALVLTFAGASVPLTGRIEIAQALERGACTVTRDGEPYAAHEDREHERLIVDLDVRGTTTLVMSWARRP